MGRNKVIEDANLLELIDRFFREECKGQALRLKLPDIAAYVRANGYPQYAVESLRRNPQARALIENLKQLGEEKALVSLVAYKTLEIDSFLNSHQSRNSLKQGLMELDNYYKTIADSAIEALRKYSEVVKKLEKTTDALTEANAKNESLMKTVASLKEEKKVLEAQNEGYKGVVFDYMYPNVANELLAQAGLLKNAQTGVDKIKLASNTVTGSSVIVDEENTRSGSKVVSGLFKDFGG